MGRGAYSREWQDGMVSESNSTPLGPRPESGTLDDLFHGDETVVVNAINRSSTRPRIHRSPTPIVLPYPRLRVVRRVTPNHISKPKVLLTIALPVPSEL